MALVKVIHCSNGATVRIFDDCYRDCSKEEIARRREQIYREIWKIDRANQLRQLEAQRNKE